MSGIYRARTRRRATRPETKRPPNLMRVRGVLDVLPHHKVESRGFGPLTTSVPRRNSAMLARASPICSCRGIGHFVGDLRLCRGLACRPRVSASRSPGREITCVQGRDHDPQSDEDGGVAKKAASAEAIAFGRDKADWDLLAKAGEAFLRRQAIQRSSADG
jgi:hypothetical protein